MNEVAPDDWKKANGFTYPSIIHASLDAGLGPIEVGRAKTDWVDIENAALRIPEKESSKNEDNWTVSLREETAEYLARWIDQRKMYDRYEDIDRFWLTPHGDPYSGKSLRVLLDNRRDVAGIERDFSFYASQTSTGTYMAREEGLAAAQSQLSYRRRETTMKYDKAPVEDRRDGLGRTGQPKYISELVGYQSRETDGKDSALKRLQCLCIIVSSCRIECDNCGESRDARIKNEKVIPFEAACTNCYSFNFAVLSKSD
jgi:hypothetical protein